MTEQRKNQYTTLAVLNIGLTFIGLRFHHLYFVVIAGVLLFVGLLSDYMLERITDAWAWTGEKMGAVMSRVVLSIIFIFFLSPIAIVYRTFAKKKARNNSDSYFTERNHTYIAGDLEKVF